MIIWYYRCFSFDLKVLGSIFTSFRMRLNNHLDFLVQAMNFWGSQLCHTATWWSRMWQSWQKVPPGCLQEKIIFDGYRQMKEHLGHRGFRLECNIHATMMTNHWILGYYIVKQIHLCTFTRCLAEDWVVYADIFACGTSHSCVQTGRPRPASDEIDYDCAWGLATSSWIFHWSNTYPNILTYIWHIMHILMCLCSLWLYTFPCLLQGCFFYMGMIEQRLTASLKDVV